MRPTWVGEEYKGWVIWSQGFLRFIRRGVKRLTKRHLERALVWEQHLRVGYGRYKRSKRRQGYQSGSYVRDLLSSYGWIEGLVVPRIREGGLESEVLEGYRWRQRQVDQVLLEAFLLVHSTRKTRRWFKCLFRDGISAQTVSNIVRELDTSWRSFSKSSCHLVDKSPRIQSIGNKKLWKKNLRKVSFAPEDIIIF